jgi:hypothetical protein
VDVLDGLRTAVGEYSWLLTRGYAEASALKLVGDRHALTERQRMAVRRCACSDQALVTRSQHRVAPSVLRGERLEVDGFNVLTTIEAALGGGVVLLGRDDAARDLAGVHGTYRKVEETRPAITRIGEYLERYSPRPCRWWLDSPVSNSGRLRGILVEIAGERGWNWEVELTFNPDPILSASAEIVATADAGILDRCRRWLNLVRGVLEALPKARTVDLRPSREQP